MKKPCTVHSIAMPPQVGADASDFPQDMTICLQEQREKRRRVGPGCPGNS